MKKLFRASTLIISFILLITTVKSQNQNQIVRQSFVKNGKEVSKSTVINTNNANQGSLITRDGKTHNFNENNSAYITNKNGSLNDSTLDIIVEFKEEPLFIKQRRNSQFKSTTHTTQALTPFYETRFREFKNAIENIQGLKTTSINPKVKRKFHKIFFGVNVEISGAILEDIKNLPYVKRVSRNNKVQVSLNESVPLIRANKVWIDLGTEGEGISVGILDTGIDYKHPAFGGNESSTFPTAKIIGGYDFVNNDNDPMDDHFHGTHCAGIVAADNEVIRGVAPKSSLYAYKVLDENGSGDNDIIIAAIERTVDPNQDSDYSDKLDIVSMSFGGGGNPDDAMSTAVDNAVEMGITFCIAAGNDYNYNRIGSPGTARKAITVGSTTKSDEISNFSSKGPNGKIYTIKPEIVAPGSEIFSSFPLVETNAMTQRGFSSTYENISGTSMAAPHIAGVCALLKKQHPNWTPQQIKSALMTTAIDIGEDAMTQGAGRVDAFNATTVSSFAIPSKLDFGFNHGDDENWTVNNSFTITNQNNSTQSYIITTNDLIAGIDITPSSSEFTLSSGESKDINITITANNNILGYPRKESMAYDGMIVITGTIDNLHIPWAFIKAALLVLNFNKSEDIHFYVANKDYYKDFNNASWNDNQDQATLMLRKDKYDIFTNFWNREHKPNYVVIKEQIMVEKVTELSISSTEAIYKIELNGVDEHGQLLSNLPYTFRRHNFQFLFPESSCVIAVEPYTPWESNKTIYCSSLSENFSLLTGELLFDLNTNRKLYIPQYDLIKGIHGNINLTNDISEYIHQNLNIKSKPDITKTTFLIRSEFYYQGTNGFGYLGIGNDFNLDANNWDGEIFLTPMKHETRGFTATIEVSNVDVEEAYWHRPWLSARWFNVYQDSVGIFKSNKPHSNVYLSPGGEEFRLGSGAIYSDAFFVNNQNESTNIHINPSYYGQLNEKRTGDIESAIYTVFDNDNNIIGTDTVVNSKTINLAAGVYKVRVINDNYYVNDDRGQATLTSTFDLSIDDAIPPGLSSLQIRNSKGVPTDKIETGDAAIIRFSSRDYFISNNYAHYKSIESDSTKLYLKEQNSENWQAVKLNKLFEDTELGYDPIGYLYSADLSDFTNHDSTYLDLKIITQDEAGNSMEWVLEPAVFVGLPENTPENDPPVLYNLKDTTVIKGLEILNLPLKAYDPDGDTLIFTALSDNNAISLLINDTTLTISPEQNWSGIANIQVKVSDGLVADSTSFLFTAFNTPPVISTMTDTTIAKNSTAEIILKASDFDGDSLIFTALSDNSAISLVVNDTTLAISPEQNWVGTANIQVKVSDGELSDSTSFVFTAINTPPVISSITDTTIGKNSTAEIILKAYDIDDDDLIFTSICDTSALSLLINDTTLTINSEQNWVGTANIQVKVSDGELSDSTSFVFTTINTPPVISSITDTTIGKNSTAEITLNAYDFDSDDLIFTSICDNSAISLVVNDTTLTISSEQDWVGTANIQVKVSDGELSDSTNFVLTIMSFTSIEDPNDQLNDYVKIYPNPNNTGVFKLNIGLGNNKYLKVDAFNMQGKLVYSETFNTPSANGETIVINLSKHQKGVYLLRITLDKIILNKKVIIQ